MNRKRLRTTLHPGRNHPLPDRFVPRPVPPSAFQFPYSLPLDKAIADVERLAQQQLHEVGLGSGRFRISLSGLAQRWRWPEGDVRIFFELLTDDGWIQPVMPERGIYVWKFRFYPERGEAAE